MKEPKSYQKLKNDDIEPIVIDSPGLTSTILKGDLELYSTMVPGVVLARGAGAFQASYSDAFDPISWRTLTQVNDYTLNQKLKVTSEAAGLVLRWVAKESSAIVLSNGEQAVALKSTALNVDSLVNDGNKVSLNCTISRSPAPELMEFVKHPKIVLCSYCCRGWLDPLGTMRNIPTLAALPKFTCRYCNNTSVVSGVSEQGVPQINRGIQHEWPIRWTKTSTLAAMLYLDEGRFDLLGHDQATEKSRDDDVLTLIDGYYIVPEGRVRNLGIEEHSSETQARFKPRVMAID